MDFNFGNEQVVSIGTAEPFDDFEHGGSRRARFAADGEEMTDEPGVDVLAVATFLLVAHAPSVLSIVTLRQMDSSAPD